MEKILTIVVPTYNMQDYLRRCLDSLIMPEEPMKLLEVLVVNDGSRDNSSAIAHEYQDKYPNTFRVIDKENGNYGSCVNRGLQESSGKYFRILDADDWFDSSSLAKVICALDKYNVDVIYTPYNSVYIKDNKIAHVIVKKQLKFPLGTLVDLTKSVLDEPFFHMHSLTYNTKLLKQIGFKQEEGICYTDTEYVFYPLSCAKSMLCLDTVLYQYFVGRVGQSTSRKAMAKNFTHFAKVLDNLVKFDSDVQPTYISLKRFYYVLLLEYMLSCHLLYCQKDKLQEKTIKALINFISQKDSDIVSTLCHVNSKGCHYIKWWLDDSLVDKIKLALYIQIKRIVEKIK